MRSLPPMVLILVLAALLVVTTPVGTGQGVHQSELLHPLLPHLHLVGGRLVTHDQLAADQASAHAAPLSPAGPALGAGSAADAAGLGLAISPTVPDASVAFALSSVARLNRSAATLPTEFRDPPQDPPPNRLA
jgi:hypothetical protein